MDGQLGKFAEVASQKQEVLDALSVSTSRTLIVQVRPRTGPSSTPPRTNAALEKLTKFESLLAGLFCNGGGQYFGLWGTLVLFPWTLKTDTGLTLMLVGLLLLRKPRASAMVETSGELGDLIALGLQAFDTRSTNDRHRMAISLSTRSLLSSSATRFLLSSSLDFFFMSSKATADACRSFARIIASTSSSGSVVTP